MNNKRGKTLGLLLLFIIFITVVMLTGIIQATSYSSSNGGNLSIWDESDSGSSQYSTCTQFCSQKLKTYEQWNFYFYSNYTNTTTGGILSGNCDARFKNFSGGYGPYYPLTFNTTYQRYQLNITFNYKGTYNWTVNCSKDGAVLVNTTDNYTITNTPPYIMRDASDYIDFDGDFVKDVLPCTEDALCYYNFSNNVSEDDINDVLSYNYTTTTNTTLTNFTIDPVSGFVIINITNDIESGTGKQVELTVRDTESVLKSGILEVDITAVNDAPYFTNLVDREFNMSYLFEYIVTSYDEENDFPFKLNITFLNCTTAPWSTRNNTNCTLFNQTQYSFNETTGILNISFIPIKNDVGNYTINFTIEDSGTTSPINASTSQIVIFRVLNVNSPPEFTYLCDNERNTTEDASFACYINVSDEDELNNISLITYPSWFTFNNSDNEITLIVSTLGENLTAYVEFTPSDTEVGNWTININATDTDVLEPGITSDAFNFYIENANDSVDLKPIENLTAYSTSNYSKTINATDDDLLVPDPSVFDEDLSFSSNHSNVSVSSLGQVGQTNLVLGNISFNPNELGNGVHYINISVYDVNNYSQDSQIFKVEVIINNPPVWNESTITNYYLNESEEFYINISSNVTDPDALDTVTFYNLTDAFPAFTITPDGVINVTPDDIDVGNYTFDIYATDGKATVPLAFNFTIYNINDNVSITGFESEAPNSTWDLNSITSQEDNNTKVLVYVDDNDIRISDEQKSYYNESLNVTTTFEGPNTDLFNLEFSLILNSPNDNRSIYQAIFTPNKTDVGDYNVTVFVVDQSGANDTLLFNLSVLETSHDPQLEFIENISSSIIENLYVDINSNDTEDINETYGNLTYVLTNLTAQGNFLTINSTTGVINFTFNQTYEGVWEYNVVVNDTSGKTDSQIFRIDVYGFPKIIDPLPNYNFGFVENQSYNITFYFNDSVSTTLNKKLNYSIYFSGHLKNVSSGYGNITASTLEVLVNFTDATADGSNLTINVSNVKLSNVSYWNLTINNSNDPLTFYATIPDKSGGYEVAANLSDHFRDSDASDPKINQSVGFTYEVTPGSETGGIIAVTITNWTNASIPNVRFSATATSSANYMIHGHEYNESGAEIGNATSNNFTVTLTVIQEEIVRTVTRTVTRIKLKTIKLVLPDPVSAYFGDTVELPIEILNEGNTILDDISLTSLISKGGVAAGNIRSYFDVDFIEGLNPGETANVTLTVEINTERLGLYEIDINASVKSPAISDWGKIYLNVKEGTKIEERIVFTEELIASNPECIELRELLDEAITLYEQNNIAAAQTKLNQTIEACKAAISQPPKAREVPKVYENLINYLVISTILAFFLGLVYYYFMRTRIA